MVQKILVGIFVQCKRRKSLVVSDNTIAAEGRGRFSKKLGMCYAKAGKKLSLDLM